MNTNLKRANGTGSVYKLSGRRRKPYVATITSSCRYDAPRGRYIQDRTTIGYYETRDAAIIALNNYLADPYDVKKSAITFEELYNEWSEIKYKDISPSAIRTWKSAFKHLEVLYSRKINEIRTVDIEYSIQNSDVHSSTRKRMKSLCNLLYKYAIKHEYVKTNYAALCDNIYSDPPVIVRKPFDEEEIRLLWNNLDIPFVDIILIGIYSGWRPQELISLNVQDINLQDKYMIGGMKTKSGKNRIVPIHSKIMPLINNRINDYQFSSNENCAPNKLFTYKSDDGIQALDYYKYRNRFIKVMKHLNMDHRPHDTRHTFITMGKEAGMNEYILKLIVGHSIDDVTEHVYTHRKVESLREEMEKITLD